MTMMYWILWFIMVLSNARASVVSRLDEEYSLCRGVDIRELTIEQLHDLYRTRVLSVRALVECYVTRIEKMDRYLKAVLEINPRVWEEADRIDFDIRGDSMIRKPLEGIPIMLKDNIGTKGNDMHTSSGSWALFHAQPFKDAPAVERLVNAGAIILGKTNLSEFAGFRSSLMDYGWSGRGNTTRNPYNFRETTDGSSSGSAVAVAANLCMAALGTETDGSIISPSSLASVVGVKPTINSISPLGIVPFSPSLDSVGVIARTVVDAYKVYNVLSRFSQDKPKLRSEPLGEDSTVKEVFSLTKKYRVGVLDKTYFQKTIMESQPLLGESLSRLEKSGVTLIRNLGMNLSSPYSESTKWALRYEFKGAIGNYLSTQVFYADDAPYKPRSLADIVAFNEEHPELDWEEIGQDLLIEANNTRYNFEHEIKFKEDRSQAQRAISMLFNQHHLNAIVVPSIEGGSTGGLAALAGYPIITVPSGQTRSASPYGISLISTSWLEDDLFNLAFRIETTGYKLRHPPEFLV